MMKAAIAPDLCPTILPVIKRSGRTDGLIQVREALLNRLSRIDQTAAINAITVAETITSTVDLAAQIRITLQKLIAATMNADGTAVDYIALRNSPTYATYQQQELATLQQFDPQHLPTQAAARAFWLNLYNALVLDAIINLNIQKSVTEGFLGLLTFFRRAAYIVGGQRVSLADIEYGILRGNRGNPYVPGVHFASDDPRLAWAVPLDPRIHFALNCGGRSCPPIRAYTPDQLDQQLDMTTRGFVDATVKVDTENKTVTAPQIFRWFASDFGGHAGILSFLINHLPADKRQNRLSSNDNFSFTYAPYNWRLNNT